MKTAWLILRPRPSSFVAAATLALLGAGPGRGWAQTTFTVNPPNGAIGISTSADILFDFSAPMNTASTQLELLSLSPPANYPATLTWTSPTNLTCAPIPALPADTVISWVLTGLDQSGGAVIGQGMFTTGSSGGGQGGSGTNATTIFAVGRTVIFDQTNAAAPVLDATFPYTFLASTSLASNRTASTITLTLPTGAVSNLMQNPVHHESYLLGYSTSVSNTWAQTFPPGPYSIQVVSVQSNQTVNVVMPAGTAEPVAPHVTNYLAAQTVDPSLPFTVGWEPWVGATGTDYIYVAVGSIWQSPAPGMPGALRGSDTSATIPAGILQPAMNYGAVVGFYRALVISNANYISEGYRATATQFNLSTTSSSARITETNEILAGSMFSFDINTSPGQPLTVLFSTNINLAPTQWQTVLVTNSPGGLIHIVVPHATNQAGFYRAREGS